MTPPIVSLPVPREVIAFVQRCEGGETPQFEFRIVAEAQRVWIYERRSKLSIGSISFKAIQKDIVRCVDAVKNYKAPT